MINRGIYHSLVVLSAAFVLFTACKPKKQTPQNTIYVSILPLRGLIYDIVGEDFPIEVLVPAGASPETFEPTPRQFATLNRAQMIFNVGLIDFETTLLGKLENQQRIIHLNEGIELIAGSCSHTTATDGHAHHHAHGIDPHIWMSPKALRRMAANAYEAIRKAYPDSAKYERNYRQLDTRLSELDARTARLIRESGVRLFIIYHPALTYYARDYGLQQVAIETDGKEPSARHLARLIQQAKEYQIHKLFYQSLFPASTVEVIAEDIGAETVRIDPLREDVISNIDEITRSITVQ